MHKLLSKQLVSGISVKAKSDMDPICEPCLAGKQHRIAVPRSATHRSSALLQLVHSDVHGPLPVRSRHHARYWITFIDDFSHFWVVYPLKDKSGAFAAFKSFVAFAENQLNCTLKAIRDDKGGEYMSREWESFCSAKGIHRQHTVRAEPHQNGVAERANRTLMEGIIAMLNESKLPGSFWWEAAAAFVHVRNRSPTASLHDSTPYELWHKSKPDVAHLRVFGCTSYVHIKKDKRKQLDSHTQKCVFIGYPSNYKAWLFWNPVTKKEVISNSAEFDERYFPGTSTKPLDWPLPPLRHSASQDAVEPVGDSGDDSLLPLHSLPRSLFPGAADDAPDDSDDEKHSDPPQAPQEPHQDRPVTPPFDPEPKTPKQSPEQLKRQDKRVLSPASDIVSPEHVRVRRPPPLPPRPKAPEFTAQPLSSFKPAPSQTGYGRFQHIPSHRDMLSKVRASSSSTPTQQTAPEASVPLPASPVATPQEEQDEEMHDAEWDRESSPDPIDSFSGAQQADAFIAQSLVDLAEGNEFLSLEDAFEYALASKLQKEKASEPTHWGDIKGRSDAHLWHAAALEEFNALLESGTFEPVKLPPNRKAIGCRWVFRLKRKPDGSVDRYKARLVAKGFSQRPGLDFGQVFAPTARWAALRAIFALAAIEDLELYSLDISNAFLNGELDHEVYMQQPEGFKDRFGPGFVLQLKRALYGLKQAGHQWHKKLDSVMSGMGFKLVRCDNSIWIYQNDGVHIIIPVYVDDMTIACKRTEQYASTVKELKKHFKLKELGPLSSLLGVSVHRDRSRRRLTLSQSQYISDVLQTFGLADVRPVATPLDPGAKLSKEQAPKNDEERLQMQNIPYSQLVGALMYLAVATRPDIAHSVGVLARFSSNPGFAHWTALKHLCRYLQGTKDYKLCYEPDPKSSEVFLTYADADYGGDPDSRRSTSGLVVKMGSGAISWASKLQPVVTLSTTEAEYISATSAGQEILWLRNLFSEIGYKIKGASTLHLDNQSAIAVTRNPEHHGRMKHLDLRHYWLRDVVKDGLVAVKYIPTKSMPADIMTKPLPKATVEDMRRMLGLREEC